MLNLLRRGRRVPDRSPTREDLKIRNLLDDPALRRAMGLPAVEARFDRRRLLDEAAA